tara:strand:- start:239 stop:463 length:225 start_codon:yes stop_codon:yes gene_type:complete
VWFEPHGFERAKFGHLIVCPLIFFFTRALPLFETIIRETLLLSWDAAMMMMFLMSLFVLFSFSFCFFLDGVFIH